MRFSVTMSRPLRQVIITPAMTRPTASGSQAPSVILARFEVKNATSTVRNRVPRMASLHRGVFHSARATARNRIVLRMKVPVTATP